MPIINGKTLFSKSPIKGMISDKINRHGVSYGLGEAGYDIRIKQTIRFHPSNMGPIVYRYENVIGEGPMAIYDTAHYEQGRFCIASAMEEFDMPDDLVGVVHDKSSWARQGLSVFNTVIEPGWKGFLTLELVFHGSKELIIPAGAGIAQVIFSQLSDLASYEGKYQHQADKPVSSKFTDTGSYGDLGLPGDNHYDPSKRGFSPK